MTFFADSIKDKSPLRPELLFSSPESDDSLEKILRYKYYCYFKDIIKTIFPSLSEKIVCDVGCGSGIWSLALFNNAKKIFLLDTNESYLGIAKRTFEFNKYSNFILIKADITDNLLKLQIPGESVDIIWCHAVLELFDDKQLNSAIKNMALLLRNGGIAFVSLHPFRYFSVLYLPRIIKRLIDLNLKEVIRFYGTIASEDFWVNRISSVYTKNIFERYGFRVIHFTGFGYIPISNKKTPFDKLFSAALKMVFMNKLHKFSKFVDKLTALQRMKLYFARNQILVAQKDRGYE